MKYLYSLLRPIESVDNLVTYVMQLCKLRDDFDDDEKLESIAPGAIESNCLSSSKSSRSLQKLHEKGDEGVHTLDETEYKYRTLSTCILPRAPIAICGGIITGFAYVPPI